MDKMKSKTRSTIMANQNYFADIVIILYTWIGVIALENDDESRRMVICETKVYQMRRRRKLFVKSFKKAADCGVSFTKRLTT